MPHTESPAPANPAGLGCHECLDSIIPNANFCHEKAQKHKMFIEAGPKTHWKPLCILCFLWTYSAPYFSCATFALPFAYTVTMKRSSNFFSSIVGTTSPPSILITSGIELL